MAGETTITVIGNLIADPEMRYTSQSVPVASFKIASTPRNYNRNTGNWEEGTAMFINCSAWREMAENVHESLTKGMRVIVTGRLVQYNWESEGQRRSRLEIQVDEVGPSLRYASAQVTRNQRNGGNFGGSASGGYGGSAPADGGNIGMGYGSAPAVNQGNDPWAAGKSTAYDDVPPF